MGLQDLIFGKLAGLLLEYLKENMPRLKAEFCDWVDQYVQSTDNEYDDAAAELLRSLLGVPK